jgi:hypothetical protein
MAGLLRDSKIVASGEAPVIDLGQRRWFGGRSTIAQPAIAHATVPAMRTSNIDLVLSELSTLSEKAFESQRR